jgi:hypothetical protein
MKVISDATDPNPREHEQAFYSRGYDSTISPGAIKTYRSARL